MADSIPQQLLEDLDCGVCLDSKELKLLPCQHRYCHDCLENLYKTGGSKISCPHCRKIYDCSPESFPVCRLANHFREQLSKSIENLLDIGGEEDQNDESLICEGALCSKAVEARCKKCKSFLCYKCIVKGRCTFPPTSDSDEPIQHDGEDMDDLVQRSEEEFETYSEVMENELETLRLNLKEREAMVEELRSSIRSETNLITKINLIEEIASSLPPAGNPGINTGSKLHGKADTGQEKQRVKSTPPAVSPKKKNKTPEIRRSSVGSTNPSSSNLQKIILPKEGAKYIALYDFIFMLKLNHFERKKEELPNGDDIQKKPKPI